ALTKCGASCIDTQTDNQNCGACDKICTGGTTCVAGACTCPANTTLCNGACVNFATDRANCGGCSTLADGGTDPTHVCAQFKACVNSQCTCTDQRPDCNNDGVCHDLNKDNQNCGACGSPCGSGTTCKGGSCK